MSMLLGYVCALLVGISLGALGMGGSILTIPIMVYLMHISPMDATGYSLCVVGITSTVGGFRYVRDGLVDLRTASAFAIPSIVSVFCTRTFLVPAIPPTVNLGGALLAKDFLILLLFAVLMIGVGIRMLRETELTVPDRQKHWTHTLGLVLLGAAAGLVTGVLGIGGGFIIIPSLVLLAHLPMRMSVGTSLIIIALNSWIGFAGEMLVRQHPVDVSFLLLFSGFSAAGIFLGFGLASRIASGQLKKMFGWVVLLTGVGIFIKEIFFG